MLNDGTYAYVRVSVCSVLLDRTAQIPVLPLCVPLGTFVCLLISPFFRTCSDRIYIIFSSNYCPNAGATVAPTHRLSSIAPLDSIVRLEVLK
jgi:hypothetical protein